MPDEKGEICWTVEKAAKSCSVSRPTMLAMTRITGFPCFRVGRKILIPRRALMDWLDRQAAEGATL